MKKNTAGLGPFVDLLVEGTHKVPEMLSLVNLSLEYVSPPPEFSFLFLFIYFFFREVVSLYEGVCHSPPNTPRYNTQLRFLCLVLKSQPSLCVELVKRTNYEKISMRGDRSLRVVGTVSLGSRYDLIFLFGGDEIFYLIFYLICFSREAMRLLESSGLLDAVLRSLLKASGEELEDCLEILWCASHSKDLQEYFAREVLPLLVDIFLVLCQTNAVESSNKTLNKVRIYSLLD